MVEYQKLQQKYVCLQVAPSIASLTNYRRFFNNGSTNSNNVTFMQQLFHEIFILHYKVRKLVVNCYLVKLSVLKD